jgi:hypothetical protein
MNKNAFMTSKLGTLILLLFVFIILLMIMPKIFQGINKDTVYEACRTQITLAAREEPIAFDACHEFQLNFGKKSAVKKDLFDDMKKIDEYNYAKLINQYENNYGVKIPEEKRLEYATYLVLAEEIKLNDYIYYANNLSIKRLKTKYAGTVCKPASLITFDQEVFQGEKYTNFGHFLNNTVYDLNTKNQLTYIEYLAQRYGKDEDILLEWLFNYGQLINKFARSKFEELIYKSIWDKTEFIKPEINTINTYSLLYIYYPDETGSQLLSPAFLNLVPSYSESLACQSYLGVGGG